MLTCQRCSATWTPRPEQYAKGQEKPVRCPRCQSTLWDKPRQTGG